MPLNQIGAIDLFSVLAGVQGRMANLSAMALARGADLALKDDYEGAARDFRRAIGLDASPENAARAHDLLATCYVQMGRNEDAIKTYQSSIRMAPNDDNAHVKLGNLYYGLGRHVEAEQEYLAAVRINPASSNNIFSLGQANMANGRYIEAEQRFKQVIAMEPNHYGGRYALGQVYAKEGRLDEAAAEFVIVTGMKRDFYEARVDLGYAYADLGLMDEAGEQLEVLEENAPNIAPLLKSYMEKVKKPGFLAVYNSSGFLDTLGPGTALSTLDSSLAPPGASKLFTVDFIFNKDMDASSVQNHYNWSITRAPAGSFGGAYNWGMPIPDTETQISPIPVSVVYDQDEFTAAVSFLVVQNADGNGTIDPSHILFDFAGKDAYGNAMDPSADQYSGISLIV